jgi:hypothetical protein
MSGRQRAAAFAGLIAAAVAFGLLLMHGGVDPALTGGHHGASTPSATTAAGPSPGSEDHDAGHGGGSDRSTADVASVCVVLAVGAALVLVRRIPAGRARLLVRGGGWRPSLAPTRHVPEHPPRSVLCVERC